MTMRHKQSQAISYRAFDLDFIYHYSAYLAVSLLACLPCSIPYVSANPETINEKKADELESLRSRIKNVENNIKAARGQTELISKELQENEIAAANLSRKLLENDDQIGTKVIRLAKIKLEKFIGEKSPFTSSSKPVSVLRR